MFSSTDIVIDLEGKTLGIQEQELWLAEAKKKELTNYQQTQIYEAQDLGDLGEGVRIGIIDTGINYIHEQFQHIKEQLKKGVRVSESDGYVNDPLDAFGHGTQVAGIICGKDIGIAPQAEIYIVKFIPQKGEELDRISRITAGIKYCESKGCDIINLSVGTPRYDQFLKNACQKAFQKGILLVASGGNHYTGALFPASYSDYVISVGSVDSQLMYVESSNVWPTKEVVAPGEEIFSASEDNLYYLGEGSSYAAPHVTGILALALTAMKQANKTVNPRRIRQVLRETADKSVLDLEQAEEFIQKYDPQRKVLRNPQEVTEFMFGAGLVQAKNLIKKLIE